MGRESRIGSSLRSVSWRLGLALAPAFVLGAYGHRPELSIVAWFGLVPWIVLYTDDRGPRPSYGYFVLAAWIYWMVAYPDAFRFGWYAPPILSTLGLVSGFTWLFAPLLARIHARFRLPRALSAPIAWVAVEWLRTELTIGRFEYQALGYTQARFPAVIQIADVVGVHGVSFLIAAANGTIADLVFAFRDAGVGWRNTLRSRRVRRSAASLAIALALTAGYGLFRLDAARDAAGPTVALVQPNVRHTIRNAAGVHLEQVLLTERETPAGEVDLIVWPENAILDVIDREGAYLDDLGWLAETKGAPILVGASGTAEGNPLKSTNSAFLVGPGGEIRGRYDKQVLFPFSEYVPLERLFEKLPVRIRESYRSLIRASWGFLPNGVHGDEMRLFRLPWRDREIPFAAVTCWENVDASLVAEARRLGARFVAQITSEGEVGGVVREHALRISILRAVENRIPYVRAANTGISCFIDSAGRVGSVLRTPGRGVNTEGVLVGEVGLAEPSKTLYARSRGLFEKACVAIALGLFAWTFLPRRRTRPALGLALLVGTVGAMPALASPESLETSCETPDACRAALARAADRFRESGRNEIAVEFFRSAAREHPEVRGEARGYAALFLQRHQDYAASRREYEAALAESPSAPLWTRFGTLLLRGRESEAAAEAFREAVRLDPGEPVHRMLLGRALRIGGHYEEARSVLETVVAERADLAPAWVELGRTLARLGQEPESDACLLRAIAVDPRNIEARFHLAKRAVRDGRRDEARRWTSEIRAIEETLGRGPRED